MAQLQPQTHPLHSGSGKASDLLEVARSLAPLINAQASESERRHKLTDAIIAGIRDNDLYGILVPACLGGAEADLVTALRVCRELARADGSTGWCFMAQMCWSSAAGAYMGDAAVAKIFGDSANVIIAGQGMPNGTAEIVDGGHVVNGAWRYGSGIAHADMVQFGCVLTKNGEPVRKSNGAPVIRLCSTTPDNVTITEDWDVMGLCGTGSFDYVVSDLFVPDDFGYESDTTSPKRGGPLYRLGLKNTTALGHTSFALGVGRRALDELRDLVQQSRQSAFGSLGQVPAFQKDYAMAEMRMQSLDGLAVEIWADIQAALDAGEEPSMAQVARARALTRYAHEVVSDLVSFAYKMAGGSALRASVMQRCFRDIHAGTQHVLVSHQIASAAGKVLLGMNEPREKWGLLGLES